MCVSLFWSITFGETLTPPRPPGSPHQVRNLPRAFLTAVFASLVYNLAGLKDTFSLFSAQNEDLVRRVAPSYSSSGGTVMQCPRRVGVLAQGADGLQHLGREGT